MSDANKYKVNLLELVQNKAKPSQRVIVLSNLSEIKKGIDLGYTRKKIFDVLTDAEVIACNYSYFVRVLKNHLPIEKTSSNSNRQNPPDSDNRFGGDDDPVNAEEFI